MIGLQDIPTTSTPPRDARASDVVARIRAIRPGRRAVLRGLFLGAATATLVPLDWYLARREASAQPADGASADEGDTGDDRSEHLQCHPADYPEEASNWWDVAPAVCYGGWRRGAYPCEGGYHREGTYAAREESYVSTRLTASCGGRNGWRWKGHRCSDAITTATFADGTEFTGTTIAACALPGAEPVPVPETGASPAPEPTPGTAPDRATSPERTAPAARPETGEDPSRPRRDGAGLLGGLLSLGAGR